jgi:hypothetical protein
MSRLIGAVLCGVLLSIVGCGEPPSCQQAVSHYYGAGCTFANVNTGQATTQQQAISACSTINAAVQESCRSKFESWLECIASAPPCDCTKESDALFACTG